MDRSSLLELETAAQRITDGLSAIQVMVIGLEGSGSQYAGAFHAIGDYLSEANLEFQTCLHQCLSIP